MTPILKHEHKGAGMQRLNHENGIAHLVVILVVAAVIAVVAFGGWYVWQKNKSDNRQANGTTQTKQAESEPELKQEQQQETIVPEGWKFYKNDEARFSFYYPPEWGEIKQSGSGPGLSYEFSLLPYVEFDAHRRDLTVPYTEFGDIEPAVVDVYLQNGSPVVQLAPGNEAYRDFKSNQIAKELTNDKICVAEDYHAEDHVVDPNPAYSHRYFAYCGLISETYGAFTLSSDRTDTTQRVKDSVNELLKTFEVF